MVILGLSRSTVQPCVCGHRFIATLAERGVTLRSAILDDVQAALEAMRTTDKGTPASPATLSTYVAVVKSLLGFAHNVGFTRFNAAPLIKRKIARRSWRQVSRDAGRTCQPRNTHQRRWSYDLWPYRRWSCQVSG